MIQIENLTYRYHHKKVLFNGLNLDLLPGKTYGLLGKNGAGKSSLIKNIAGLLFPTTGSCIVNGHRPSKREVPFLEQLFFLPEEFELPKLLISEWVSIYGSFYPDFDRQLFEHSLNTFSVPQKSHLHKLSFGQKKKAYLSFAFAAKTNILVMDEPTNGLDIPSKIQFRNLVSETNDNTRTTLISTHQVKDLDDLVNSIIIINDGEVLLNADMERLSRSLCFTGAECRTDGEIIYVEEMPQGMINVSIKSEETPSYVDLEILFNATLKLRKKIGEYLIPLKPTSLHK